MLFKNLLDIYTYQELKKLGMCNKKINKTLKLLNAHKFTRQSKLINFNENVDIMISEIFNNFKKNNKTNNQNKKYIQIKLVSWIKN